MVWLADLCENHEDNVRQGRPCAVCPSNPDNMEKIKALSDALKGPSKDYITNLIKSEIDSLKMEILSLRSEVEKQEELINKLSVVVLEGNGNPSLKTDVEILKRAIKAGKQRQASVMTLIGLFTSLICNIVIIIIMVMQNA